MIRILKSKLHNATITDKYLHYTGSLGIDAELMERAGIKPYEEILVVNITNGERFVTYAIEEERGSRRIVLNGAAARLGEMGDKVIIMAFRCVDEDEYDHYRPTVVILGQDNEVEKVIEE